MLGRFYTVEEYAISFNWHYFVLKYLIYQKRKIERKNNVQIWKYSFSLGKGNRNHLKIINFLKTDITS